MESEDRKLKILVVHNFYKRTGGEDTVVKNEMEMLRKKGHDVLFYSRNNNELDSNSKVRRSIELFSSVFSLKTFKDICYLIVQHHIDVVHVHNTFWLISPSVYYACRKCSVPVVQTVHNFRFVCPGATLFCNGKVCNRCLEDGMWNACINRCYRESFFQTLMSVIILKTHRLLGIYKKIYYICLSDFTKELIVRGGRKNFLKDSIYVKPNFVPECEPIYEKENYYLFLGRVERIKGCDLLINTFKEMPERKIKIVGTGAREQDLKDYCVQNGIDNVEFMGYIEHDAAMEYVKKARAVIVPSQWYETFGMIIAEAYSCGTPVIVGDIGNISFLVEDGKCGVKFKYDSAEKLKEAIVRFESLNQSELRLNAYKEYQKKFLESENYKILVDIYYDVMERQKIHEKNIGNGS